MATKGRDKDAREDPRLSSVIPIHVEISQAWEGTIRAVLPGALLNVSRGGAGVRLLCVLPPRTRLVISVQAGRELWRLLAEVVWTSLVPGQGSYPGVYGIRWLEKLSPKFLDMLLGKMDHATQAETEDAPGS